MSTAQPEPRVICFHKQKTSARTRFFCHGASVLSAGPLPALEARLQLGAGSLCADPEFNEMIDSADGPQWVLLAEFVSIDPPMAAAATVGARFIALTEARNLPAVELELLRKAYEHILG